MTDAYKKSSFAAASPSNEDSRVILEYDIIFIKITNWIFLVRIETSLDVSDVIPEEFYFIFEIFSLRAKVFIFTALLA